MEAHKNCIQIKSNRDGRIENLIISAYFTNILLCHICTRPIERTSVTSGIPQPRPARSPVSCQQWPTKYGWIKPKVSHTVGQQMREIISGQGLGAGTSGWICVRVIYKSCCVESHVAFIILKISGIWGHRILVSVGEGTQKKALKQSANEQCR